MKNDISRKENQCSGNKNLFGPRKKGKGQKKDNGGDEKFKTML